ncbi:MAG: hypothetical protein WB627_02670 [Candidatus Acidiferrum sp.]
MTKLRVVLLISLALVLAVATKSNSRDDRGPDLSGKWPTTMTAKVLQNESLLDPRQIVSTWTRRLASERTAKDVWTQVYFVQFKLHTGNTVVAIALVDESPAPDMRGGPLVYVVSKVLQPDGKPTPAQK